MLLDSNLPLAILNLSLSWTETHFPCILLYSNLLLAISNLSLSWAETHFPCILLYSSLLLAILNPLLSWAETHFPWILLYSNLLLAILNLSPSWGETHFPWVLLYNNLLLLTKTCVFSNKNLFLLGTVQCSTVLCYRLSWISIFSNLSFPGVFELCRAVKKVVRHLMCWHSHFFAI